MTSLLAIVGCISVHRLSVAKYTAPRDVVRPGRSLMSMNALLIYCNVNRFGFDDTNTKMALVETAVR